MIQSPEQNWEASAAIRSPPSKTGSHGHRVQRTHAAKAGSPPEGISGTTFGRVRLVWTYGYGVSDSY
nr:hypothetical protein [bacterium]